MRRDAAGCVLQASHGRADGDAALPFSCPCSQGASWEPSGLSTNQGSPVGLSRESRPGPMVLTRDHTPGCICRVEAGGRWSWKGASERGPGPKAAPKATQASRGLSISLPQQDHGGAAKGRQLKPWAWGLRKTGLCSAGQGK